MGGDVKPGDHHSMGGIDFVVLGEGPVDVTGGLSENIRTGVLTEVNLPHTVTRVQVPQQSCNRTEFWGQTAKICGLACRLCCGNKTIGVDLK